jgi:hypothetical protein
MKNSTHITLGYAPELARQIASTVPGMAHWAAGGPFGATCSMCASYGYWRQTRNHSGDVVSTGFHRSACGKYHELTGKHGCEIPARTEACRYFQAIIK